jgi:hypothetical protein
MPTGSLVRLFAISSLAFSSQLAAQMLVASVALILEINQPRIKLKTMTVELSGHKDKRRGMFAHPAPLVLSVTCRVLEVILQRELNDTVTVFSGDLAKVVNRGLIETVSLGRVTHVV